MANKRSKWLAGYIESARDTLNELRGTNYTRTPELLAAEGKKPPAVALREAIIEYSRRRARDRIFQNPMIFGDTAWDILLDLYLRNSRNEAATISDVIDATTVPASTAARWLNVLEAEGLVSSRDTQAGGDNRTVSLTSLGHQKMSECLTAVVR